MSNCKAKEIDFIIRDNNPQMEAVEDDIVKNLEAIGIKVNTRKLNSDDYTEAELNGDYHLLFSQTWGAPYDPHSYMGSWAVPAHVEYSAIGNLEPPLTRDILLQKIEDVQGEIDKQEIAQQWREIHEDVHKQSLFLPLWGSRIPFVINRRLIGFTPSDQAYSLPVQTIIVNSGEKTATISPGVGTLFEKTGPINPHQYSPNALWAQDWIYEGLVSYGQDGVIEPALAESWVETPIDGGQRLTFQLKQNVTFHDGTMWNCTAAKLNFDHVLSDVVKQRHEWTGTAQHLKSWTCADDYELVLETSKPFYPLLQELSYIRPFRFASPSVFAEGIDSHPDLHNSCESGDFGSKWSDLEDDVTCMGLTSPVGTGPFKFVSREDYDNKVTFAKNEEYWGTKAGIETLHVVRYNSTEEVEAALKSNELDMALGIGPLSPGQVDEFKTFHSDSFDVRHSEVVQNFLLVFNSNREPTNDIEVRRAIIHAIDKATFLEEEFSGLEKSVYQLLPETAPYCDVDLTPKWGYDVEKAELLNCPDDSSSSLSDGAIVGIAIASIAGVGMLLFIFRMVYREKQGKPLFEPKVEKMEMA